MRQQYSKHKKVTHLFQSEQIIPRRIGTKALLQNMPASVPIFKQIPILRNSATFKGFQLYPYMVFFSSKPNV
jgi:hypothetical protein